AEMFRMTRPGPHALFHLRLQAFSDDGALERGLLAADWKSRVVHDPGAIAGLSSREGPGVGLLDLRGVDDADAPDLFAQPALSTVLGDRRLEWWPCCARNSAPARRWPAWCACAAAISSPTPAIRRRSPSCWDMRWSWRAWPR